MENKAIKTLFATYIHQGKWDIDNVPESMKDSVMKIVSELKEKERLEEVDEYV